MSAWTAKRITADAAQKMQVDAGLLLNNFDITNPVEPSDSDIVCETTGDFKITCRPETEDMFDDVNGAPKNTMEGKRIVDWTCGLSVTAFSITADTLGLALGAFEKTSDNKGVVPKRQFEVADFKQLYWVGDMMDNKSLFVVVMDNTVSTGGLDFSASDNGKGTLSLELTPHATVTNRGKVPMAFYILEKSGTAAKPAEASEE